MNNDLISREALKEALSKEIWTNDMSLWLKLLNVIDNAPTVDLKDIYQEGHYDGHLKGYTKAINEVRPQEVYINGKDYNLYLEGYKQGKKDFERTQGKWITRTEDNGVNYRFYCSCCNREVLLITDYCPYCGADMRGGDKE